ncbi:MULTISPECIES: hypothetical protein [Halomonas]|uniref:Uncharacterized protein n=1 Tax=Halomonas chromatireducens TaxID=507626 RepID=A0A125R0L4_9GAMM|nr:MULTISPECIES: hypothetical protein [Halomonas]AMD02253.1 hypothetical protein LOKO_03207 [Halomonas chromatireducens]MBZ0329709.1 hypothetical protein [Halomonas sp. ANAO-440]
MNNLSRASELSPHGPLQHDNLEQRLVQAKLVLDDLERNASSKDMGALSAARVEFALAARALADELIAQGKQGRERGE